MISTQSANTRNSTTRRDFRGDKSDDDADDDDETDEVEDKLCSFRRGRSMMLILKLMFRHIGFHIIFA